MDLNRTCTNMHIADVAYHPDCRSNFCTWQEYSKKQHHSEIVENAISHRPKENKQVRLLKNHRVC